jgi:hypothetical protein
MFQRTNHFDVADGVLVDELPHLGGTRVMHPHSTIHELYAGSIAGGENGVEVGAAQSVVGFSSSRCLPRVAAAVAQRTWTLVGSGTYTASTSGSSRRAK